MKRFLLSSILFSLMCAMAFAKDGPFPMNAALGSWKAVDQNIAIEISVSHWDKDRNPVLRVKATTAEADKSKRRLIGLGIVTLVNPNAQELVVQIENELNQKSKLTLTPLVKASEDGHDRLEFKVNISQIDQGSENIPTSLVRVLDN